MTKLLSALALIFIVFPASVFVSTLLWNMVLVEVVTWANPISFWQMLGLMVLFYIIWPGSKNKISVKDDE